MVSAPRIPSGSFMGLAIRRLISAKPGLILIQGPAVRRPNSANPGFNFNPGFFFVCSKAFSLIIFSILPRTSNL